jgi:hypothetical protein
MGKRGSVLPLPLEAKLLAMKVGEHGAVPPLLVDVNERARWRRPFASSGGAPGGGRGRAQYRPSLGGRCEWASATMSSLWHLRLLAVEAGEHGAIPPLSVEANDRAWHRHPSLVGGGKRASTAVTSLCVSRRLVEEKSGKRSAVPPLAAEANVRVRWWLVITKFFCSLHARTTTKTACSGTSLETLYDLPL